MRILHHTLVIVCCFAASVFLAWKLLQPFNYGYSFWYQQLDIGAHINKFAPQNRQGKSGFENTSPEDHHALFSGISKAVNNGGVGLRELSYKPAAQAPEMLLLTDAEAVHLEDVARLIDAMVPLGWFATILLVVLIVLARMLKIPLPGLRNSLITLLIIALLLSLAVFAAGPSEVFKSFHELVFPDDNQWFFYYQDSLMTTLMKAPDIFFAITVLWAVVAIVIYLLIAAALRALSPALHPAHHQR